jgi:2-oxo-4-hydroxy-4-carboxy-5-ureidoimidazoline decarboxylase
MPRRKNRAAMKRHVRSVECGGKGGCESTSAKCLKPLHDRLSCLAHRVYVRRAMAALLRIEELNRMDPPAFVAALGHVCEHAPWVAVRTASRRPFASRAGLHEAMCKVVQQASEAEQMALICGHPELAGKAAISRELTADSTREQQGAGLDRLTRAEYERFHVLNAAYRSRFGFPFIMAVKGCHKDEILSAFAARLDNARDAEFATALEQIGRISGFRLADLVTD